MTALKKGQSKLTWKRGKRKQNDLLRLLIELPKYLRHEPNGKRNRRSKKINICCCCWLRSVYVYELSWKNITTQRTAEWADGRPDSQPAHKTQTVKTNTTHIHPAHKMKHRDLWSVGKFISKFTIRYTIFLLMAKHGSKRCEFMGEHFSEFIIHVHCSQ